MFNLFIVSTPRHWLLSLYLRQGEYKEHRAILVLESNFVKDSIYLEISRSFFDKVIILKETPDFLKLKKFKKIFCKYKIQHMFSGSVNESYVQYGSHLLKKLASGRFYLLDDGLFTYQKVKVKPLSKMEFFFRKLIWGGWFQHSVEYRLSSPWVDGAYVLYPEKISSINNRIIKKIEPSWLDLLASLGIMKLLWAYYKLDIVKLEAVDYVLVLDIAKNKMRESLSYKNELILLITFLERNGKNVFIKQHPRDKEPLGVEMKQCVTVLPKNLPFELISFLMNERVKLIGDISTTLIDFKVLKPQSEVIACLSGSQDSASINMLSQSKIRMVKSYKDIVGFKE